MLLVCFFVYIRCFFVEEYVDHRYLHVLTHAFPTRRSSDLPVVIESVGGAGGWNRCSPLPAGRSAPLPPAPRRSSSLRRPERPRTGSWRSEEHTSELKSLMRISYAVFCLKNKMCLAYTHNSHTISINRKHRILPSNQQ